MATNDGFQPDRSPIFLSGHAEETEQPDIGRAWDIATISSRILKTSILAVTVTAIGIAILSIGNPVALVANVTDWWVDKPALQPEADPSTSTIQTIASTQDLPPTTTDTPPRDEIAAAVEPADQSQVEVGQSQASQSQAGQSQAEISQPLTEELFKQFQAWAAEGETRAQTGPAQPVQAAHYKGDARCPNAGPAREKAPTGPVRAKCTSRDPVPAKSSSKGSGGARCTGTGPARSRSQSTGPVYAKCPNTVAPAKPRFAQLGPAGSVARVSPRIAKGAPDGAPFVFRSSRYCRAIRIAPS